MNKITLTDENGYTHTINESAEIIGCKATKIRHYIRAKGAKTIADVQAIIDNILRYGRKYAEVKKTHETKYGALTLCEIWDIHPYKDSVSIALLSVRICHHGGMHEGLWQPMQKNNIQCEHEYLACVGCLRKLEIRQFPFLDGSDQRHDMCLRCRGKTNNIGKGKRGKSRSKMCIPGDVVTSRGKEYVVAASYGDNGEKRLVTGHRKMSNGQILRRTNIDLGTNWSL